MSNELIDRKPRKMWAAMNYDTIWTVGYTRSMCKHALAQELRHPGRKTEAAVNEMERRLKDGSFRIRRCYVTVEP